MVSSLLYLLAIVSDTFILGLESSASSDFHFKGRNIALGQKASQHPGTYKNLIASNAVDGNTDTSVEYGGSCAHTDPQHGPAWWTVEFDRPYRISGIIIYSRSNQESRFRLMNFTVTTSNDDVTLYDDVLYNQWIKRIIHIPIDSYQHQYFNSVTVSVPVNPKIYVDNGNSMVTLCEVEIYTYTQCPLPTTRNGHYQYTSGDKYKDDVKFDTGETVRLVCDEGYHPYPEKFELTRRCQKEGSWEHEDVWCVKPTATTAPVLDVNHTRLVIVGLTSFLAGGVFAFMILVAVFLVKKRSKESEEKKYTYLEYRTGQQQIEMYDQLAGDSKTETHREYEDMESHGRT